MNYIDHWLIAISTITGCVYFSSFTSLAGIPTGITSSAIGLRIVVITAGFKKYESKFIKEQEASGLLSSLGINISLNKIPLLGPLLF